MMPVIAKYEFVIQAFALWYKHPYSARHITTSCCVPESVDFESLQSYDVADLLKQYFRELPECLLTNKLSDTFISIFTRKCEFRIVYTFCRGNQNLFLFD